MVRELSVFEVEAVDGGVDTVATGLGGAAAIGTGFAMAGSAGTAGMAVTAAGLAAVAPVALVAIGGLAVGYALYEVFSK